MPLNFVTASQALVLQEEALEDAVPRIHDTSFGAQGLHVVGAQGVEDSLQRCDAHFQRGDGRIRRQSVMRRSIFAFNRRARIRLSTRRSTTQDAIVSKGFKRVRYRVVAWLRATVVGLERLHDNLCPSRWRVLAVRRKVSDRLELRRVCHCIAGPGPCTQPVGQVRPAMSSCFANVGRSWTTFDKRRPIFVRNQAKLVPARPVWGPNIGLLGGRTIRASER